MKNPTKNAVKNATKNRSHKKSSTFPVNRAVSANKGSDLLLLCSNNRLAAGGRFYCHANRHKDIGPQLLSEGQIVYLHKQRRIQ